MSKKLYIFSTLAASVAYTNYAAGGADLPVPMPSVLVHGGAGVANERIVTPRGVVTEVTEDQLQYLRENKVFQLHEKNGFVMVSEANTDPDKAAADMEGRDNSAPIVPQDGVAGADTTVVIGGEVEEAPAAPVRRKHR